MTDSATNIDITETIATRLSAWALLLVALAGAGALLWPLTQSAFYTDDYYYLRHLKSLGLETDDGLSRANLEAVGQVYVERAHKNFDLYRPSVFASFGLNLVASQTTQPFIYQLTTLCLHLACAVMLWRFIRIVVPRSGPWPAFFAVTFFLISPLQLEVVSWNSARSDSISFFFGMAALTLKAARPRMSVGPALLALVSMTAKETALFYPLALVLLEFVLPAERGSSDGLIGRVRRAVPTVMAVAIILSMRWYLFGKPLGGRYAGASFGHYADDYMRYATSAWYTVVPISSLIHPQIWLRVLLAVLSIVGFCGALGGIVVGVRTGRGRVAGLATGLVVFPFALHIALTDLQPTLSNTRHLYLPVGGLSVLLALWLTSKMAWRWKLVPVFALFAVALVCSRAQQQIYLDSRGAENRIIRDVRDGIASVADVAKTSPRIVILGYRDHQYPETLQSNYTSFPLVFKRPFASQDWQVIGIRGFREFADLLATGKPSRLFMGMTPDDSGRTRCRSIVKPSRPTPTGQGLELLAPEADAEITFDLTRPDSLNLLFRIRIDGVATSRFDIGLLIAAGSLGESGRLVKSESDGSFTIERRIDPGLARRLDGSIPVGWYAVARDEEGKTLATSEVRLLIVTRGE